MREIMQEYGKAVITLCVMGSVFFLLWTGIRVNDNTGFFKILKSSEGLLERNSSQYSDTGELSLAMERNLPVIIFSNIKIKANTTKKAEELFTATDAEGNQIIPKILKVTDQNQQELEVENNQVTFLQQGVYRILVKAMDDKCSSVSKLFCVPVQCR